MGSSWLWIPIIAVLVLLLGRVGRRSERRSGPNSKGHSLPHAYGYQEEKRLLQKAIAILEDALSADGQSEEMLWNAFQESSILTIGLEATEQRHHPSLYLRKAALSRQLMQRIEETHHPEEKRRLQEAIVILEDALNAEEQNKEMLRGALQEAHTITGAVWAAQLTPGVPHPALNSRIDELARTVAQRIEEIN